VTNVFTAVTCAWVLYFMVYEKYLVYFCYSFVFR